MKNKLLFSCLVALSCSAIIIGACKKGKISETSPSVDYKEMKIGEFTAAEIGEYHNVALSLLKNETLATSSKDKVRQILSTELPKIENRFTSTTIDLAYNDCFSNHLFTFKQGTLKSGSVPDFLENGLRFYVSKNVISEKLKTEIIELSKMDIESMKIKTNVLVNSSEWNDREKQFFAVYTSIYESSIIYWSNLKKLKSTSGLEYAADAAGGVLGLAGMFLGWGTFAVAAWSIVQGAVASFIVSDTGSAPEVDAWTGA